ncbi:HAD-IB family hydrolase, partial [Xanthomonas oryzae pv. oryzae]
MSRWEKKHQAHGFNESPIPISQSLPMH